MGDRRILLIFTGLPEVFVPGNDTHFNTTRAIAVTSLLWGVNANSVGMHAEFASGGWILPSWRLKRGEFRQEGPLQGTQGMFYYVWLKGSAQDYQVQFDKLSKLRDNLSGFSNVTSNNNYMWVVGDHEEVFFTRPGPNSEPLPIRLIFNQDEVQAIYPPVPITDADLP